MTRKSDNSPTRTPHFPIAASEVSHYPFLVIPTRGRDLQFSPVNRDSPVATLALHHAINSRCLARLCARLPYPWHHSRRNYSGCLSGKIQRTTFTGKTSVALLAAHPPVHQCLGAPRSAQMPHLGGMRQKDVPLRQLQHGLFRGCRNERRRLSHCQPPVLRIAPRIAANIAVVSLSERHTNNFSVPQGTRGKLAGASSGGPSPEVGMPFVPQNCHRFRGQSRRQHRSSLPGRIDFVTQAILAGWSSYCSRGKPSFFH
jgi:hypothetical protein